VEYNYYEGYNMYLVDNYIFFADKFFAKPINCHFMVVAINYLTDGFNFSLTMFDGGINISLSPHSYKSMGKSS
jgi:hypothetical protein